MLFSMANAPFYIPPNTARRFQFLCVLTDTQYFMFFRCSSHPNGVIWCLKVGLICKSLMIIDVG